MVCRRSALGAKNGSDAELEQLASVPLCLVTAIFNLFVSILIEKYPKLDKPVSFWDSDYLCLESLSRQNGWVAVDSLDAVPARREYVVGNYASP